MTAPRVLIVEDEAPLARGLSDALSYQGYACDCAPDGPKGLAAARAGRYDVMILDVMLPELSGFDVIRTLRSEGSRIPTILLTAKGAEADRVRGLDLGADDYVTKPFSLAEVLARVGAQVRRARMDRGDGEQFEADGVRFDLGRLLAVRDGGEIPLTPREGDILRHLRSRAGNVVTRDEFLLQVWQYKSAAVETRTVDNTLAALRKKIERDPADPAIVLTVPGERVPLGRDVNVRHPLLVFGLLLVGPAVVLALIGWRSVAQEDRLRRTESLADVRQAAEGMATFEAAAVSAIKAREEKRPYYHYQSSYMPEDLVSSNGPGFVASPLTGAPDDPRVRFWFQWTLSRDVVVGPELFGSVDEAARAAFRREYEYALVSRLRNAPQSVELRAAPMVATSLAAVAANEEVGQLLEEVDVSQRAGKQTSYLDNFNSRVQQRGPVQGAAPTVGIRYGPVTLAAGTLPGTASVPLVAYRLVWIPGQASKERRDAPEDRWLLQGAALDVGRSVPPDWTPMAGDMLVRRGALDVEAPAGSRVPPASASIAAILRPELLPYASPSEPVAEAKAASRSKSGKASEAQKETATVALGKESPSLSVLAIRSEGTLLAQHRAASTRYVLVLAGLFSVVGIGFFVLWRSVRREMALAERKQDFVAAVTHELKTPLTGIRMYADMLREGWVPEGATTADYAGRIVDETRRLSGLVDQVLDLASFDRGVATCNPVSGDLGAAVESAAALLASAAEEAQVPVRVEIEAGLPPVAFDPALVRPMVLNLLDNAIKYSARAPTKEVVVAVRRVAGSVAVVVSDRGPGIPKSERGRLFEPFSRGGREETRTARGVGLGLALVRRYADAHKAKIDLDSEPGRGTTVTVRFPA